MTQPDPQSPLPATPETPPPVEPMAASAPPALSSPTATPEGGPPAAWWDRTRTFLGLERNIVVILAIILILGIGEEMWFRFIPLYLKALGATVTIITLYGTIRDLLDGIYQYPGGWLADRMGRRSALMLFLVLSMIGYLLYLVAPSWEWVFVGLFFIMAWHTLALPAIFAVVGDSLPRARRTIGFGVQSAWKRVPTMIGVPIGGYIIAWFTVSQGTQLGLVHGVRLGLGIAVVFAVISFFIVRNYFVEKAPPVRDKARMIDMWRGMDRYLKRLLFAECLTRWADSMINTVVILWVVEELHHSKVTYSWLDGTLRVVVATLSYLPLARSSEHMNRKPFVLLTFLFFALFPLTLVFATNSYVLILAFVIAGLKEVGEPARKAMIVDLAQAKAEGRAIGMYYLIRNLVVCPAAYVGGLLWEYLGPEWPFFVAFGIGMAGFVAYLIWGPGEKALERPAETVPTGAG